jgi:hypothetical protein
VKDFSGREIRVGDWLVHAVTSGASAELRWLLADSYLSGELACLYPRKNYDWKSVRASTTVLRKPGSALVVPRESVPEQILSVLELESRSRQLKLGM